MSPPGVMERPAKPEPVDPVRLATAADVDAMVRLHLQCFDAGAHLGTALGKSFLREVYRWFVTSPRTFGICCAEGGELIAFATVCQGPYHRLMFSENKRAALRAFLSHPWIALHPQVWARIFSRLSGSNEIERMLDSQEGAAHCGLLAVRPDYRRSGLAVTMNRFLFVEARKRGWRKLIGVIHADNIASIRATEKAGYVRIETRKSKKMVVLVKEL
ncbi:MAG: GNAT family N-acetyltransferase [bacterium]